MKERIRGRRLAALMATLLVGTAVMSCSDELPTTTSGNGTSNVQVGQRNLIAVNCVASRTALNVACDNKNGSSSTGVSPDGRRYDIVFGGNHVYANIVSSNVAYGVDSIFSFDVTVQNLIQQTLGTTDGTNPDPAGVRIFFAGGPTVTGGSGTITIPNASGMATFTAPNQLYFQYSGALLGADGILSTNETSGALNWHLKMPPSVTTFSFTIFISAEVQKPGGYITLGLDSDHVVVGSTRQVTGTVRSALGDSVGVVTSWVSLDSTKATVNGSGVVSGVAQGIVGIRGNYHNLVDSTTLFVCNNFSTVGSTFTYTGQNGFSSCFAGGAAGAEYTFMPVNIQSASSQSATVTGTGIQPVTGPPSPDLKVSHTILSMGGQALQAPALDIASDMDFVGRDLGFYNVKLAEFRARNNQRLLPGLRTTLLGAPGPVRKTAPVVGDLLSINTTSACSGSPSVRTGQIRSIGQHVLVVGDTANPAGGFTTAQYDSIALEFDSLAWPVDSANFGAPTDVDGNGHVIAFFTRAVNELSPPASSAVVLGFFAGKDVFDTGTCSNSNGNGSVGAEVFYMLVPDPTGAVNSNVRTVSFVRGNTTGTLGHEFQHMINAFRRAYVTGASSFEEGYLNEGLSHIAEELIFYRTSVGLAPRGNIVVSQLTTGPNASRRVAAFNTYANQNYGRLRGWLQRPDTAGAFKQNANSLAVRGAIWAFLRYASDRVNGSDPAFWYSLVNNNLQGTANIQNAIGANPQDWLRDFTAAMYDDDAGYSVDPKYTQPSWNFRSLYTALNGSYQLAPRPLTNGVGLTLSYSAGGGTAYGRFSVAAGTFAQVTTLNGGPIVGPFSIIVSRTK